MCLKICTKDLIGATLTAARKRLRPILMTSLAFGLGVLPLAIATGAGSGSQNVIGTWVLGGTLAGTLLGIFFIPLVYVVITRIFKDTPQVVGVASTALPQEEARRNAQISLVAEVASTWLTLGADRERLALARSTYETRQKSFDLTRRSLEAGAVSALDLHQSQTLLEGARADLARYNTLVAKDENALALVVGAPVPADLLPATLTDGVSAVAELPAGVPSAVLVRRPDILQAERALRAANASIGAARAAFFPSITLTAAAGTASSTLDGLFGGGSGTWSFMPQIRIPIFEAGRLQASLDVAEVQRDINVAQYEKAIQRAFREVADALGERATLAEQLDARRTLVAATESGFRLSEARYKGGVDSHLGMLDAQRTLYSARLDLIGARLADATSRVTVYTVLGSGWR